MPLDFWGPLRADCRSSDVKCAVTSIALAPFEFIDKAGVGLARRFLSLGLFSYGAAIGNRLTCEHVVTVFDAGRDSAAGLSYLTMELLEGTDLQRHVEQNGPVAPATAVEYLRQVAVGIDQAHSWRDLKHRLTPIVHRDLKPANLFLSKREDGTSLIKILDFGIATILERSAPACFNIRGSPLYMAPEQVSGAPISPATDIWAIGLLTFFLLTSKAYWAEGQDRRSALAVLLREVTRGATVLPSRRMKQLNIQARLPEAFDRWFLRCVHRDPNERFRSAGVAVVALAKALNVSLVAGQSRRLDSMARLQLTSLLAPNPSGSGSHWWQPLWFWLGAVGGFCAVFHIAGPRVDWMASKGQHSHRQTQGSDTVRPMGAPASAVAGS